MDFKFPAIFGIIVFFLIFFINIIVGNSFLIIVLRSLLTGGIVFLIVFGIIFLFKNVFKIDLNSSISEDSKIGDKLNSEVTDNVDLVVDDNIDTKDYNEEYKNIDLDKENSSDSDVDSKESFKESFIEEKDLNEIKSSKIDDIGDIGDINIDDDIGGSDLGDDKFKDNSMTKDSNLSTEDIIKEKLGYNVTNQEIAKAIRTVLKRDG